MKKSRAILIALGVPLLYLLLQFAVVYAVVAFYFVKALSVSDISDMDKMMELVDRVTMDTFAVTVPITIIACGILLIIIVASYRNKPYSAWSAVGLTRGVSKRIIMTSIIAGFGFNVLCVGLISAIPVPETWSEVHDMVSDMLIDENNIILTLFFTAFVAPIVEEIVFRGFTQRFFQKIMPVWAAALLSGTLFGLTHFNWLQTIYAFTMGVMLGFLYAWAKNLWATVAFHMAFNGANFLVSPVLYVIYGDVETLPLAGACVMIALGAVISVYCVVTLYKNRNTSQPVAFVEN